MTIIVNPTLPNILTNGTTADATQVMGNFSSIISQINSNAAENGANSSITSLSGLTTPLSVPQGGTGQTGPWQTGCIILGNGSGPLSLLLAGTAGYVLTSGGASTNPSWTSPGSVVTASVIETSLGFVPVQQGTGIGQASNTVKIGWNGSNALKATVDSTDQGYMVMSSTDPVSPGVTVNSSLNAPTGLYDNSNRVWSPGNYQPLTVNGIGYDAFVAFTTAVEGNTYSLGGRPGTWLCLSSFVMNGTNQAFRRIS